MLPVISKLRHGFLNQSVAVVCLAVPIALTLTLTAQAAVVIFVPSQPVSTGDLVGDGVRYLEWDLIGEEASAYLSSTGDPNVNGTTHIVLSVSQGLSTSPSMSGPSQLGVFGAGDSKWSLDIKLPAGTEIGPDLALESYKNFEAQADCFSVGESGFIGYTFNLVSGTHYGYANITYLGADMGYQLNYWAYESVPDAGIAAGAQPPSIPEPATWAVLPGTVVFVFSLFLQRRRVSKN